MTTSWPRPRRAADAQRRSLLRKGSRPVTVGAQLTAPQPMQRPVAPRHDSQFSGSPDGRAKVGPRRAGPQPVCSGNLSCVGWARGDGGGARRGGPGPSCCSTRRTASGEVHSSTSRRRPAQCAQASTSSAKECLSYCTSRSGLAHGPCFREFSMLGNLLGKPVEPLARLVADARLDKPLRAPPADRSPFDSEFVAELLGGQHPGGEQPLLERLEASQRSGPTGR